MREMMLNTMRRKGIIDDLYDICINNQLFSYYMSLFQNERENFYTIIKTLYETDSNDYEKVIITTYEKTLKEYSELALNEELSEEGLKSYVSFLAIALLYDCPVDSFVISYINNIYFKKGKLYMPEEHILLIKYMVDYLNKSFNSNLVLSFQNNGKVYASITDNHDYSSLIVNKEFYESFLETKKVYKGSYNYMIYYETFALLHELFHSKQFNEKVGNESLLTNERLKKELIVKEENPEFYHKYHENFLMEQQANEFGFLYTDYMLKNILNEKEIKTAKRRVVAEYVVSQIKIISDDEFLHLLEDEYNKIMESKFHL